jgi:sigma-B regulation protein RsbU (phosphoserine phosphatase)
VFRGSTRSRRLTSITVPHSPLDVSNLEALLESAQLLHASLDLDELLKHLLRTAMGRLVAARGLVATADGEGMRVALARGCRQIKAGVPFDEAIARECGLGVFVTIGDPERPLGVLGLAVPPRGSISEDEGAFLEALSGLAASGIANAHAHQEVQRLNTRLDQKIHELGTLLELVRALSRAEGADEVAHLLGLTLSGQWAASRYAVFALHARQGLVVRQKGAALVWQDAWLDELDQFGEASVLTSESDSSLCTALAAQRMEVIFPLQSASGTFGFAAVGSRPGGRPYADADRSFGTGVVAQAVVAFENAWHQADVVERKQFERELSLAASIQQNLFPSELPALPGYALAAMSRPARLVGGDYYDALVIDAPSVSARGLFCVADVSGKGIAASLLMSNIQATLRALLGREAALSELARCINDLLHTSTPENKYATAVFLTLEPATGVCHYVSAGHTEALVMRRDGAVLRLGATGLALGLFPGVSYDQEIFTLEPGDLVALYSDGISEALSIDEEEYGVDRLVDSLRLNAGRGAEGLLRGVVADLDAFVGDAPQYDDITLLVVERIR